MAEGGAEDAEESYLSIASGELRKAIITEWQDCMQTSRLRLGVCAVCGRKHSAASLREVNADEVDLTLLRNEDLPAEVTPTTYAFEVYDRAVLHPKGLFDRWARGSMVVCGACSTELLTRQRMPKFALANWLYYGYDELPAGVRKAFRESTRFERVLIARARASRISFTFRELHPEQDNGKKRFPSQQFVKGNVMVMPQDATHLNSVLPPSDDVVRDTVCAVFVGRTKPTRETIGKLRPVLVRKSKVRLMIEFLVEHNPHYAKSPEFHGLSRRNLDKLFHEEGDEDPDVGVPCAMEIGFLDSGESGEAVDAATSDYTGRNDVNNNAGEELVMENVGFTESDVSPKSYKQMKMRALTHCLQGGKFVRSQAGSRFVPDFQNPQLLSWLFPALDPWGIGGFFEPRRSVPLTLEDQLKCLVQREEGVFASDPDFAFVYYNIRQKKAVCDSINYRVRATQARGVVEELLRVNRDVLERLVRRFEREPMYKPVSPDEENIVRLLSRVSMVGRDLPGTAGYKVMLRNEIRGLMYFRGTPALFVTLNPSDVTHPLVRLYAGENIDMEHLVRGEELTEWRRKLIVANNPVACAMFFDTMIRGFLNVVLRYGRPGRGLFG
ncbi:hypothetical protein C8Q73DRAFT_633727, partial [Cubamyces lactineus]